jgi:hypothetical protein
MALSEADLSGTVPHQQVVSWGEAKPLVKVGFSEVDTMYFGSAHAAAVEVQQVLSVPDGVRIERATFALAAESSGRTDASSVGEVRAVDSNSVVVDFGRLVTVGGISPRATAKSPASRAGTAPPSSLSPRRAPSPSSPASGCW